MSWVSPLSGIPDSSRATMTTSKYGLKKDFDTIRLNGWTIYICKNSRSPLLEKALATGEKHLSVNYQLVQIASSAFSRVYGFVAELGGCKRHVIYKRYLYRSAFDFVKHICRASKTRRACQANLMLQENNLGAPEVIAFGERRKGSFCTSNFLLTAEIENAKRLYRSVPTDSPDLSRQALRNKRELIAAFGRTVGRMHACGIFHGDLRLGNVLTRYNADGWQFFFIDNERTKKFKHLPDRLRLKNLVQINMYPYGISNTDRLRFLNNYLCENPCVRHRLGEWIRKIVAKTNRRLRKTSWFLRPNSSDCRLSCD
jgi:hypothetical protein